MDWTAALYILTDLHHISLTLQLSLFEVCALWLIGSHKTVIFISLVVNERAISVILNIALTNVPVYCSIQRTLLLIS